MGLFSNWFKGKPAQQTPPAQTVLSAVQPPTRSIKYDASLVAKLKSDHGELVELYGTLGKDAQAGR
ncbi:hypothetical protein [Dokdonella soli]|uniref:Uncharacterized protein n=1 Tax=Dokdonella soli TaxID=529810 RepID=A0ABN1IRR6_9GAMM